MKNINFELKIVYCLLLMAVVLMIPSLLHAQTSLGQRVFDVPKIGPDGVSDAPIDGGLSILLAAGVGYGCKKLKEYRKKAKDMK